MSSARIVGFSFRRYHSFSFVSKNPFLPTNRDVCMTCPQSRIGERALVSCNRSSTREFVRRTRRTAVVSIHISRKSHPNKIGRRLSIRNRQTHWFFLCIHWATKRVDFSINRDRTVDGSNAATISGFDNKQIVDRLGEPVQRHPNFLDERQRQRQRIPWGLSTTTNECIVPRFRNTFQTRKHQGGERRLENDEEWGDRCRLAHRRIDC